MTPREIQSLMRRIFYFRISTANSYRHLMKNDVLDADLVTGLINDYIHTKDIMVYANAHRCAHVAMEDAYKLICDYRDSNPLIAVQVVASDFSSRVLIESIGVGIGETRRIAS